MASSQVDHNLISSQSQQSHADESMHTSAAPAADESTGVATRDMFAEDADMPSFPDIGRTEEDGHPQRPSGSTEMRPSTDIVPYVNDSLDGMPLSEEDSLELLLEQLVEEGIAAEMELEGREMIGRPGADSE
eukprot:6460236-Amphidinium_carterae.1